MDDSMLEEGENVPQLQRGRQRKQKVNFEQVLDYVENQGNGSSGLKKCKSQYFDEWLGFLLTGINILLRGHGSKVDIVEAFLKDKKLTNSHVLTVHGEECDVSVNSILAQIVDQLELGVKIAKTGIVDQATQLAAAIEDTDQDFLLVIHNIDGTSLRREAAVEALNALCSSSKVHLLATMAFPNGDLYWPPDVKYGFRFVEYVLDTYHIDVDEFLALNPKLENQGKGNEHSHTLESLDMIWVSLASHTQRIFLKLYELMMDSEDRSVLFLDLFSAVRAEFLTTSEVVLETQITELKDHFLINVSDERAISFTAEPTLLAKFVETKMVDDD